MYELEVDRIPEILDSMPSKMCVMFIGDTGVGKTTIIERYCKERNIFLKTLILSQLEASEALGIPVRMEREFHGVTYPTLKTAIPEWVFELHERQNTDGGAMLFLDEFLCAQPSTMNSFLNFLTQRNVQGLDLSRVKVVAATNVGNYTFDPDTNMISRFCMFYTINTRINEFLKDKRVLNDYTDENQRTGVLFEQRSLKPRCQELLMEVDDEHFGMFYQGFTNRECRVVHSETSVNSIVHSYFEQSEEAFTISDANLRSMLTVLVSSFPRVRKWTGVIKGFRVDMNTQTRIMNAMEEIVGKDHM